MLGVIFASFLSDVLEGGDLITCATLVNEWEFMQSGEGDLPDLCIFYL